MKLPFSLTFGKKEIKNHFLALLFQDEKIGAVVFEETAGTIQVISHAEEHFTSSLEEAPFDELLDIIDKAVSTAEGTLNEGIQTEKTVFGVKQEWISEGKIKKDYLIRLKKVCDELQLQPIGFLVFTEAIIHLLQKEEGAPVSAILVETGKKLIDISIIRAGRIVANKKIPFTTPVPHAVDEALKQFNDIEIFPSRIILFDSDNNEKLSQSFIHHSWSKSLPFLHMPQVTILPQGFDTKGVLYGTATQMGFEVSDVDFRTPIKTIAPQHDKKTFIPQTDIRDNLENPETLQQTGALQKEEQLEEEVLGNKPHNDPEFAIQTSDDMILHDSVSADYFGFIKNGDITNETKLGKKTHFTINAPSAIIDQAIAEIPEEVKDDETELNKPDGGLPVNSMLLFDGIKKGIANIKDNFSFQKFFQKKRRTSIGQPKETISTAKSFPKRLLILPLLLILIIAGFVWYVTAVAANVIITVSPKVLEDKEQVTFAVGGSSDNSKNIIAASDIQVQEQGTLSQDATGTKAVGTPAKGSITIFSIFTNSTNIPQGTKLTSDNGLVFTLTNAVNVGSFSGDISDPPVTISNVSVTANDIGPNYNLPSGTKFTINGLDKGSISAKNDAAFSGGTQQNITVVSQKDEDALVSNLTKNLETKAQTDISNTAGNDKVVLPFFTKEEVTKKTFSKNVGDQAKSVSLDATITYHSASYTKNDLQSFSQSIFQGKIPSNSTLSPNGIQATVSDPKNDNQSFRGSLDMKASFLPKLDTQTITQDITGKSFNQAQSIIQKYPQVSNVAIQLQPNIPFLPKLLPRFSKNIHVSITNE